MSFDKKRESKDYGNIFFLFGVLIKCFYFIMVIMFTTVVFSAKNASVGPGVAPNTGLESFGQTSQNIDKDASRERA